MEITSKITRVGNSYFLLVPKALVDCKIVDPTKKYKFDLEEDLESQKCRLWDLVPNMFEKAYCAYA